MIELNLEKIQKNNWIQGTIVTDSLKETLMSGYQFYNNISGADLLVLYTHDCDLINLSLEKEPYAEFFCVKKIKKIDHNYSYGKNPRKMHLEIDGSIFEFDINKTLKIDRAILAKQTMESKRPKIPQKSMVRILKWLSRKY